jgi:hypothetical protein
MVDGNSLPNQDILTRMLCFSLHNGKTKIQGVLTNRGCFHHFLMTSSA